MEFALDYDVPIFQNQLADRFHKKILDGAWKFDLSTTRWVYSTIPAGTGLRDLFALSLYTIPIFTDGNTGFGFVKRGMERKHPVADEWRELSCEYFDLGADFAALRFTPDAEAILKETADTCQFHNHGPHKGGGCLTFGVLWRARKSVEEALAGEAPSPPAEESPTEEPPAEEAPLAEDYPAEEAPADEAAAYSAEESQAESPVEDAASDKVSIANRTVSTLLQKREALENKIVRQGAVFEIAKMHNNPLGGRLWREMDSHLDDLNAMAKEEEQLREAASTAR